VSVRLSVYLALFSDTMDSKRLGIPCARQNIATLSFKQDSERYHTVKAKPFSVSHFLYSHCTLPALLSPI